MLPFKSPSYLFFCNAYNESNMAIKLSKCKHLSTPAENIKEIFEHMEIPSNLFQYQIDSYQR